MAKPALPRELPPLPDRQARVDPAVGPLDDLSAVERRVFADPTGFRRLDQPRPGTWRSRVEEPPQTFADYVVSAPNAFEPPRQHLYILPLGSFPVEFIVEPDAVSLVRTPGVEMLADFLGRFFPGVIVGARPELALEDLRGHDRIRRGHAQWHAPSLALNAGKLLPLDAYSMVALLNRDLYAAEEQQYSFGYGLHRERIAVMSFTRFDPMFTGRARAEDWVARIRDRSLKVIAHEVAHTFGLRHCTAYACVLNGLAHPRELDATPLRLCPICLRKLGHTLPFDPRARYKGLLDFFVREQMRAQARWTTARLERIEATAS